MFDKKILGWTRKLNFVADEPENIAYMFADIQPAALLLCLS